MKVLNLFVLMTVAVCLFSAPALAYIGPGIVMISYLFGPVIAVIATVAMILFYPMLLLYRKIKSKKAKKEDPSAE